MGAYDVRFFFWEKTFNRETLVLRVFFWAVLGLCWTNVGPMLSEEQRVLLGLDLKAQKNTLFLGHVRTMLGLWDLCCAYVGAWKENQNQAA